MGTTVDEPEPMLVSRSHRYSDSALPRQPYPVHPLIRKAIHGEVSFATMMKLYP